MLDTLTLASFTPHVGGAFRLSTPDGTALTLTLDEAQSLASPGTRAEDDRRKRGRSGCCSAAPRARSSRNASTRSSTRSWDG